MSFMYTSHVVFVDVYGAGSYARQAPALRLLPRVLALRESRHTMKRTSEYTGERVYKKGEAYDYAIFVGCVRTYECRACLPRAGGAGKRGKSRERVRYDSVARVAAVARKDAVRQRGKWRGLLMERRECAQWCEFIAVNVDCRYRCFLPPLSSMLQ